MAKNSSNIIIPLIIAAGAAIYFIIPKYPITYGKKHPDVKILQAALGIAQTGVLDSACLDAMNFYYSKGDSGVRFSTTIVIQNRAMLDGIVDNINILAGN